MELELRLGESSRLWRLSFSGRSVRGLRLLTLVKSVPGMAVRYSSGAFSALRVAKIKWRSKTGVNIQPREHGNSDPNNKGQLQVCFTAEGELWWWIFTSGGMISYDKGGNDDEVMRA